MIPLFFVRSLIEERANRQQSVIQEINSKWGKEVILSGPILKIPYYAREIVEQQDEGEENDNKKKTLIKKTLKAVYFLPETLDGKAQLDVKKLKRSIYESAVYEGTFNAQGSIGTADFTDLGISEDDILWDKASLVLQTRDLKGIKSNMSLQLGEQELHFSPPYNSEEPNPDAFPHPLLRLETETFDYRELAHNQFNFELRFNGSQSFKLLPIAKEMKLNVQSNWTSPSFSGEFLPKNEADKITDQGFNANWEVLYYNRPFPQTFLNSLPNINEYAFGVDLLIPVDEYQKSERSAKYGYLVISFTFLFFFLIQAITKINMHPFQYLLIGLALVLFYTLLISISEHSNFLFAYLISAGSVVGLVSIYSVSVLKKNKFALMIALSLSALYSFIYIIIQLENYALLAGSIGLFVILAIVMFVSRKIEWK